MKKERRMGYFKNEQSIGYILQNLMTVALIVGVIIHLVKKKKNVGKYQN